MLLSKNIERILVGASDTQSVHTSQSTDVSIRVMPILGFYSIVVPGIVLVASIVIIIAVLCCVKQPVNKNTTTIAAAPTNANNNRRVTSIDDPTLMSSSNNNSAAFTIEIDNQSPPAFDLPPSYEEATTTSS